MIGRDIKVPSAPLADAPGDIAMSAVGVRTGAYPAQPVSLELRNGEILGLAGLVGSGRTELARAMFGVDPIYGGHFELRGEAFRPAHASQAIARGIFLVPEDRQGAGVLLDLSIAENISLPNVPAHAMSFLVARGSEIQTAETQKRNLGIMAPSVTTRTGSLSGGNQQKVVLAKWLAMSPKIMIFDEPTRGIDIGAKAEIYRLMRELAEAGVAVLMISSDMEEVIGVSDRIAVMHEGRVAGILDRDRFSGENVLLLAVGKTISAKTGP
jgi:ribose transport system ATP-binding protein